MHFIKFKFLVSIPNILLVQIFFYFKYVNLFIIELISQKWCCFDESDNFISEIMENSLNLMLANWSLCFVGKV